MMRTAFLDGQREEALARDGCAIVDFLDAGELGSLRQALMRLGFGADDGTGFPVPPSRLRNTVVHADAETKDAIFAELSPGLQRAVDRILQEYVLLRIGVFDKLPGGAGIEVHQHATLVDESTYRSLTIWLPATDTSVAMGTLHVVKGSHEFTDGFRSKNRRLDDFRRVSRRVLERYSTPITLRAGQAIVFDDRLIHWSPPNRSLLVRTALQLMLAPDEADLVTYYRTNGHELAKYAVDRRTYREHWMTQVNPETLTPLDKVSQPEITYGDKEFLSMVRRTGSTPARVPEPLFSRVFSGIRARLRS
jgi:hypothetical protein